MGMPRPHPPNLSVLSAGSVRVDVTLDVLEPSIRRGPALSTAAAVQAICSPVNSTDALERPDSGRGAAVDLPPLAVALARAARRPPIAKSLTLWRYQRQRS